MRKDIADRINKAADRLRSLPVDKRTLKERDHTYVRHSNALEGDPLPADRDESRLVRR